MARKAIAYVLLVVLILLSGCGTADSTKTTPSLTTLPSAATSGAASLAPAALKCPDTTGPIKGSIVFVSDGNLYALDPQSKQTEKLTTLPTIQWSQNPVWSPDAKTLAYTLNGQNPDPDLSWLPVSMICGFDRTTGKGRVLAQGKPFEALTEPSWTSDGSGLYVSLARHQIDANKQYVGTETEVARYDFAGKTFTTIAKDSSGAALSRDGKHLAYVYNNPKTFELQLMLAAADGQNPQPVRGPGDGFGSVLGASWSSDSSALVFAASSGSAGSQSSLAPRQSLLERVLGIKVAQAHGAPMDIWVVDADGQHLQQLTAKNYDDPRATWSPDKQSIAIVTNSGGVLLLDVEEGTEQQLTDLGNMGGITWADK